jgi:hypothetical protein
VPTPSTIRVAGAALAAGVLLAAAPARAGTYVVDQCTEPSSATPRRVLAEWAAAGEARKYVDCGTASGSFGLELPGAGAAIRYGAFAWLGLSVPARLPDVEVARVRLAYRVRPHKGNEAFLELYASGGRLHSEPLPSDRTASPLDLALPAGARAFDVGLYCATRYGAIDCSWTSPFEVLRISSARLTLRESTQPSVSVDGGSLLAGGERSGRETVLYSASDAASGVERVAVRLGGVVVAERDLAGDRAACPRDGWSACAPQRSEELEVDTQRVPDGTHQLTVTATDAAGNARIASGGSVTVRNRPAAPPPSTQPSSAAEPDPRGAANGAPASDGARLSVHFEESRAASAHVRHGRTATLAGQLVDERGRPIAGAVLDVSSALAVAGAQPRPEGAARTDADGRFSHAIAADASRTIAVAYRARERDAQPAARADLALHVPAPVTLRARPARLRNGRVVTLAGSVLGRPLPLRGVVVDLQVRLAGRWRSFAVARTTRTGRYRHRHRFRHVVRHPSRFRFRARVRRDAAYPFTSGRSRVVGVRVSP